MSDKKKGDKNEKGSFFKVDLKYIAPLTGDDEIMKQFERLSAYKVSKEKLIHQHNHFIRVRNVAATIPNEYLSGVNLDGLITVDDIRRLLIAGCEAEIKEARTELEMMTKHFKEIKV